MRTLAWGSDGKTRQWETGPAVPEDRFRDYRARAAQRLCDWWETSAILRPESARSRVRVGERAHDSAQCWPICGAAFGWREKRPVMDVMLTSAAANQVTGQRPALAPGRRASIPGIHGQGRHSHHVATIAPGPANYPTRSRSAPCGGTQGPCAQAVSQPEAPPAAPILVGPPAGPIHIPPRAAPHTPIRGGRIAGRLGARPMQRAGRSRGCSMGPSSCARPASVWARPYSCCGMRWPQCSSGPQMAAAGAANLRPAGAAFFRR